MEYAGDGGSFVFIFVTKWEWDWINLLGIGICNLRYENFVKWIRDNWDLASHKILSEMGFTLQFHN